MALITSVTFEEELKKNPELRKADVQTLRDWYKKQPHLPKISNSGLALFLHSNYYRLEPTKISIDNYFTMRTHIPEFFSDQDIKNEHLKKASETVTIQILKGTTKEGYKIIYGRLLDNDPSHYVYNDIIKYSSMMINLSLYIEGTSKGHIFVLDMTDFVFAHISRINPLSIKKSLYYLQEAIPIRLKEVHFINTNAIMDIILSMIKPFMKKELMEMLHIHPTKDTLKEFIPLEIFPCDVGLDGKSKPLKEQHEEQLKQLENHREWFFQDEVMNRVNEVLRVGKSKTMDLFGVEGSFKKLDID